ncbi:uncharacterized protein [Dermacentor albipictus]|uniref:uncharacterized protein n=1 Tax=Dermacentor albipictus TaxID=60249 RepID=UPI0038FC6072
MMHVAMYLDDITVTGSDDEDFLQNLHNVLARLQDAGLKLKLEKCVFLAPSKEQDRALQLSKELITKASVLVHFDPAKPVVLTVDASPYGVGAVLAHRDNLFRRTMHRWMGGLEGRLSPTNDAESE